jgi:hypothetical protein
MKLSIVLWAPSPRPQFTLENARAGAKRARNSLGQLGQDVSCTEAKKQKDCLKMQERSGNIYENKGPGLHSPAQTGNVIENKDTYELKAVMLCAPQRRGSPVGGSPTQIVVGKSGS